ncbi:hypothetical protein GM668_25590 [Duganella ginsengisoli]|uniref:Uncharacterized protein n=1 Tax=Pseudoduganella ginsengisoli TaxID=1462440 RepID=A0A6L6Q855_9BURK|nr:hypothetical protein [Pseudoduganella ginsengisoli]
MLGKIVDGPGTTVVTGTDIYSNFSRIKTASVVAVVDREFDIRYVAREAFSAVTEFRVQANGSLFLTAAQATHAKVTGTGNLYISGNDESNIIDAAFAGKTTIVPGAGADRIVLGDGAETIALSFGRPTELYSYDNAFSSLCLMSDKALSAGDTITFWYQDHAYTATVTGGLNKLQDDIDAAVSGKTVLGKGKIVVAGEMDGIRLMTTNPGDRLGSATFADNDEDGAIQASDSSALQYDTVRGFQAGKDKILLSSLGGAAIAPTSLTRFADVSGSDVQTPQQLTDRVLHSASFQALAPNQAGLITVTDGAYAGVYLYIHRPGTGNFDASRDLFIKLEASSHVGETGVLNVADYFDVRPDTSAPQIYWRSVGIQEDQHTLSIAGFGLSSVLNADEDPQQDIKHLIDWAKLALNFRSNNGSVTKVQFTSADVESAHIVSGGSSPADRLLVVLTPAKIVSLKATPGYGQHGTAADTVSIDTGFIRDSAGNASLDSAYETIFINAGASAYIGDNTLLAPKTQADSLLVLGSNMTAANVTIDCVDVGSDMVLSRIPKGHTVTLSNADHIATLVMSESEGNIAVESASIETFYAGEGNDRLTSTSSGPVRFYPGGGADVLTGGTGMNRYIFKSDDFTANDAESLLAMSDTITNWSKGKSNIEFTRGNLSVTAHNMVAVPGKASVSAQGLAGFDISDNTLVRKLLAVAAAVDMDRTGTAVIFNHGGHAYIYVVNGIRAGVESGDGLVRLENLSAAGLQITAGNITGVIPAERPAPEVTISALSYDETGRELIVRGSGFDTILGPKEAASTDIKAYLDWNKLVWDINGDGKLSPDVQFAVSDIESVRVVSGALSIILTPAKHAELLGTAGYGSAGGASDHASLSAGFIRNSEGKAATTDVLAASILLTTGMLKAVEGQSVKSTSNADFVMVKGMVGQGAQATVDFTGVTSEAMALATEGTGTVKLANIHYSINLRTLSAANSFIVSSDSLRFIQTGDGSDQLISTGDGAVFDAGGGPDLLTGGSKQNTFQFASANFKADSAQALLKAADTITNWENGADNKINFGVKLSITSHSENVRPGSASISPQGLATFDVADSSLESKLNAVVSAVGADAVGTAVAFNHGADAFLFIVGNANAGVQNGDGLIRLNGVTAKEVVIKNGVITDFNRISDMTAPISTIKFLSFHEESSSFYLGGTGFDSILSKGDDDTTDIKSYFDWSKIRWDINGDGSATADIGFTQSDIQSVQVAAADSLRVVLTPAKAAEIVAASGYGKFQSPNDKLEVSTGFIRDEAGNPAVTDGVAGGSVYADLQLQLKPGAQLAPVTRADSLSLTGYQVNPDGVVIDCADVRSSFINVSNLCTGSTVTITNADYSATLYADSSDVQGNLIVTSAGLTDFRTGAGNDQLVSTAKGKTVTFNGGAGADVLTGGTGTNLYLFAAGGADFNAGNAADLLKAADTITNWKAAASNEIRFAGMSLATAAARYDNPVAGKAAITAGGLAVFHSADNTPALKLAAAVAAMGTCPIGTAVVFNDGGNAYIYIAGNAISGVQAGDGLIKLAGVSAGGLLTTNGKITGIAPYEAVETRVTIGMSVFREDSKTLMISGEGFEKMLNRFEDISKDFKQLVDWSKFVWDLDRFVQSQEIGFAQADIVSARLIDGKLQIVLTDEKVAQLVKTPGYGGMFSRSNGVRIDDGFIKVAASGNVDFFTPHGFVQTQHFADLANGVQSAPASMADTLLLSAAKVGSSGADVDFAGARCLRIELTELAAGTTLTLSNIDRASTVYAPTVLGNLNISSATAHTMVTGAGSDHLVWKGSSSVWFTPGAGADVLTGGNGYNNYIFSFDDYRANDVASLLAGADTITNWNEKGAGNALAINYKDLTITAHDGIQVGKASVSKQGLASFADADNTLILKLQAVVVATDGDPVGSAVIFNDGTDAYLYVVGNEGAGVRKGDVLVRFNNVTATQLRLENGYVTELNANYPGPVLDTATIAGDTLVLKYKANLSAEYLPGIGQFEIKVDGVTLAANGSAYTVAGVKENTGANSLVLKLATPVKLGQTVTVAYTDLTARDDLYGIQDPYGNDAASAAIPVTNITSAYVIAGDTATAIAGGVLNLSDASNLAGVHSLVLSAEGNQVAMSARQHAVLSTVTAPATKDTFIIRDAFAGTGQAAVESYELRDVATFKLGSARQNVAMASGPNLLDVGAYQVTGTLAAAGNGSTMVVHDGADISAATISGFSKLVFDPAGSDGAIQVTMTGNQHNQLIGGVSANAANVKTITLASYFNGTGFAQIENYKLGDGRNFFALGAASQNVTGGPGEDHVSVNDYTVTGTLDGGDGIDWFFAYGDISKATIKNFEHATVQGTVRMSIAQNDGFGRLWMDSGAEVVFTDAGAVKLSLLNDGGQFQLADGKNEMMLPNLKVTVIGGSGDDSFVGKGGAIRGKYDGGAGMNTLSLSGETDISAAQFSNISKLELSPATKVTMTALQNNQLVTVWQTDGAQKIELTGTGGIGRAGIEEYDLKADFFSSNPITFTAANSGQIVRGSDNDDTITGGMGADVLYGGRGNNILNGGAGDDTLVTSRRGADQLTGGAGSDTFNVKANTYPASVVTISDFHRGNTVGVADKFGDIKASQIIAAVDQSSTDSITYAENAVLQVVDHSGNLDAAGVIKLFGADRPFAANFAPNAYFRNVTLISANETGNAQVWAVKVSNYLFAGDVELIATLTGVNDLAKTSFDMFNFTAV